MNAKLSDVFSLESRVEFDGAAVGKASEPKDQTFECLVP